MTKKLTVAEKRAIKAYYEQEKAKLQKQKKFSEVTTVKITDLTLEQAYARYGEVGAEMWANKKYGREYAKNEREYFKGRA